MIGKNVTSGDYLYIANLKGTPYEMGVAFGKMYAGEMQENLKLFYNYYLTQINQILDKKLPNFLAKLL